VKVELTESQVRNLKALLQSVAGKIQTDTKNNPKLAESIQATQAFVNQVWIALDVAEQEAKL
jgi:hypothetical protein